MLLLVFDELILLYTSNVILVYDIISGDGRGVISFVFYYAIDIVSINCVDRRFHTQLDLYT